jgi:hypothetical protein
MDLTPQVQQRVEERGLTQRIKIHLLIVWIAEVQERGLRPPLSSIF